MSEETEIGDIVEWGESIYDDHKYLLAAAPRGTVEHVFKNGSIKVVSDGGSIQKLRPSEYTLLSKAG